MKLFGLLFIVLILALAHKTSARFQTSPTFYALKLLKSNALAAEYLVSNVTELNAALAKVQVGDVIVWKDGAYKDIKINFNPKINGTADKPITLKAQTAGEVTLSGSSKIAIGGDYLQVEGFLFEGVCTLETKGHVIDFKAKSIEATHCHVTNCAIKNYSMTEASEKENYFVNMVGTYNEVDHCYFSGKTNKGPTLIVEYKQGKDYVAGSDVAPTTHHRIHHNYFGYRTFSKEKALTTKDGFKYGPLSINAVLMDSINQRLAIHNIKLTEKDIRQFDSKWKLSKKDVGVSYKL